MPAGQGRVQCTGSRWAVDGEHRGEPVHGDVADPVVGRVGFAVGEDQPRWRASSATRRAPGRHPYHHGFGHAADECGELVVDLFQVAVVVQVVGFDVGDHGDAGRKHEEGAVAFVGLHHDDVVRARISAEPGGDQLPADDIPGHGPQVLQHHGDHGRGGGLAVGSRDGDPVAAQQQCAEGRGARQDAQVAGACFHELRVGVADRGGDDDRVGVPHVLGGVADVDGRAELLQFPEQGAVPCVTAGHFHAALQQHARDSGHARAPHADEVDAAQLVDFDRFGRFDQAHRVSPDSSE